MIDHLKGIYVPVYLGDSLCQFFNNTDKFGSIDPIDNITNIYSSKLMDFLPCVKAGFLSRNSVIILFYIYIKNNDLKEKENKQYSHFDDLMTKIFVEMNAEFYINSNHNKMLITEAIEQQIIEQSLSTQEVIRLKRPEFNQDDTPIKTRGNLIYRKSYPNYYIQLLLCFGLNKNNVIYFNYN